MWTKDKIADEVASEKIVVFAKGTKDVPRCGFSARAIQIVGSVGKPFKVIDVLADATCRPALVEFSQWPTTPQVYLDGELLGGSDIIMELYESGELQKKVAESFGEEYKASPDECPISITPEAASKVKEFMEGEDGYMLRLEVRVTDGERSYGLELDTRSHPAEDTKYSVNGLSVVHAQSMRELFDKLEVRWISDAGNQGFAVKEVGEAPPLPLPLRISRDDAARLLEAGKNAEGGKVWLVDVREDDEWKAGHAEGAVHLPLSRLEKEWEQHGFGKQDTVLMYCKSGGRSGSAVDHFRRKLGYRDVRNIGGLGEVPKPVVTG